jgi:hypothetical protein
MAAKKKARRKRSLRAPGARARRKSVKNPVKMRKAPKGWMKARAVRVVRRGGKRIVEVMR